MVPLFVSSEGVSEDAVSVQLVVVLNSETAIVPEDVAISSGAITLIVKSSCLFAGSLRFALCNWTVELIHVYTGMTEICLVHTCETSVVLDDLGVSSTSISKVGRMFGVEGSLESC